MLLRFHRPGPPLDRFVELVTYYAGYEPEHTRERLLPDGAVEIVVDLTESPKKLYDREDPSRFTDMRRAWISGMRREWIVVEAAPGAVMAVIRFRPGGALPFLGFPVEELTEVVDHLDGVLGAAAASLRDRMLGTESVDERLAAVEAWLLERARGRLETNAVIDYLAHRLFAPAGLRVADVVAEVGYSGRHVRNLFRRWVGLSPKQYGRIRRFQQVLAALASAGGPIDPAVGSLMRSPILAEPDWADVALRFGYYDQSHLARDFRELAGLTPNGYLQAFRGLENYLPLD